MECIECGSKRDVYIFFDKEYSDVMCWNCLLGSCGIEKRVVEKFVDVLTDFVFYDKDELIGYILEMEEVNIQSEEAEIYYDNYSDEYIDGDEYDLVAYIEEKYNAKILDANECPECGAVMQQLYLIEDGSERAIMCYNCLLEKYNVERKELEDEDRIRFWIKDKSMEVETWEAFEDDIFGALEELYEITITEL